MMSDRFMKRAVEISVGSLSPTINWTTLKLEEFMLPQLDQQRRVAESLMAVDHTLEAQLSLAEQARSVLELRVNHLLWRGASSSPQQITPAGVIPKTWRVATYGDVTNRITYGFTNPMPTTDDGPWMITAKDVLDGRIHYETARHTSQEAYDTLLTAKSRPKVGDVLLTKDGTIGRVAIVDRPDICISQSVALIEPNPDTVTAEFLAWSLRSVRTQKKLLDDAGGSTIKHIYITKVATTSLAVPPLEEQRQIIAEVENMKLTLAITDHQVETTRALLRALVETIA
jgi:type I restriction enzyme, S subunit